MTKTDRTFAADIAQMMADWNAATPQQRDAANAIAAARANAAHRRLIEGAHDTTDAPPETYMPCTDCGAPVWPHAFVDVLCPACLNPAHDTKGRS